MYLYNDCCYHLVTLGFRSLSWRQKSQFLFFFHQHVEDHRIFCLSNLLKYGFCICLAPSSAQVSWSWKSMKIIKQVCITPEWVRVMFWNFDKTPSAWRTSFGFKIDDVFKSIRGPNQKTQRNDRKMAKKSILRSKSYFPWVLKTPIFIVTYYMIEALWIIF